MLPLVLLKVNEIANGIVHVSQLPEVESFSNIVAGNNISIMLQTFLIKPFINKKGISEKPFSLLIENQKILTSC